MTNGVKQWLLKLMLPARQADRPNFIASSLGAGADVWGTGTLTAGIVAIALIVPVFVFRHYIQDKGVFPAGMLADLTPTGGKIGERKAGMLPYVTLAAGVGVAAIGYVMFWT